MKPGSRVEEKDKIAFAELLQGELLTSQEALPDQTARQSIQQIIKSTQTKAYYFYTNELNSYFSIIWNHIIEENPDFETVVLEQMGTRTDIVFDQLLCNKIQIEEKTPLVPFDFGKDNRKNKLNVLKQQSEQIKLKINEINQNLSGAPEEEEANDIKDVYKSLYSEQKIKEAEEFVKKKREQQLERKKKLKEQRKKEQEALLKKEQQIKEHEEELAKARRQQILKKQKELHQRRDRQKSVREQRNTEYMRIRKSLNEMTPLHKKLQDGFSRRYQEEERERMKKMHSQRKHYMEHLDKHIFEKHEKQYEELREKKQKQRKQRLQKLGEQDKSRIKAHSSFQMPPKEPDPKQVERQLAKEKRQKIKQYRAIVRQKFKPKVDEAKKKQLMNLIEQMEIGNRRVKKTKLPNGSVILEEIKAGDAKMMGMEYLERVKQMAARARLQRKNSGDGDFGSSKNVSQEIKKPIDYLQQLRRNRPKQQKLQFVNRKNLSYEQKVKHVMQHSEKLAEATKQNQMMLKFGKFKTSQEILQCKEEIDQNYLDIVNMKLKLIMNQADGEDSDAEN